MKVLLPSIIWQKKQLANIGNLKYYNIRISSYYISPK